MECVFSYYVFVLIIFQEYVFSLVEKWLQQTNSLALNAHCVSTLCPECTAKYKKHIARKEQFLMTETYLCNYKWIRTTKYPHNMLFLNTYNFHNGGIQDQTYLKFYHSDIVNTQRRIIDRRTRGFVYCASWWKKWEWIRWKPSNIKVSCLLTSDNERYTALHTTL